MRPILAVFALFACCISPLGAQEIDKKALREALQLPSVYLQLVTATSSIPVWPAPNVKGGIAELVKAMEGNANDAERYQRLSDLYAEARDKKASAVASAKAVELYRQRVNADPSNG